MPTAPTQMSSGSAKKDPPAAFVDPKAAKPEGPVPSPPTPTAARPSKKKASKKKAAKKKATKKAAPKKVAAKEIDAAGLDPEEARLRCAEIYRLEREVEKKRKVHETSRNTTAAHKRALTKAEESLEKEIREQRFGPGPLFPV